MRPAREGDLVRAVIQYLNARGAFAWRNQSGMLRGTHKGKPWAVRMGTKGMPDVLAVMPQMADPPNWEEVPGTDGKWVKRSVIGRLIAVECKRPGNNPTKVQEHTMAELRKRGALVVVAYDVRDVEKALA